jgi:PAS domain S-box-containing protein
VLITATVISFYVIRNARGNNFELLLDHGRSLAIMIAQHSQQGIAAEDRNSLHRLMDIISSDPTIAYIFILNAEKQILTYKTAPEFPIHIPPMAPLSKLHKGEDAILHQSYFNKEDGKQYLDIVKPVVGSLRSFSGMSQKRIVGYVHVGVSQEGARKQTRDFFLSVFLFTTLIIFLGIIVTIFITRRIIAPIHDLQRATREIAEGKLDRQIDISTNDEVSDLAKAFNDMLLRLQHSHRQVARQTADMTVALERMRQEIVERVRTEKALKDSEKKYRDIFEESKDVIFISSSDGRFLDINKAGAELFGYPSTDALRTADLRADLFDSPEEYDVFRRMLERQGFVKDHEVTLRRTDGEKLTVLITASIIPVEQYPDWTCRGVFHDMTEKRQLETQLAQSQKMEAIGQLAGGIAHDFNNILTAIMGYANLLILDMPEESPLKNHAEHILSSSERAANLTRSLLAFSRKQVISPKQVNLCAIVTTIEKLLIRLIGEDIELKTVLNNRDVVVLADSGQIEQVLINLCTNARDAMPSGGVLSISITTAEAPDQSNHGQIPDKPEAYAVISVSDTGTGINDKIREKIFEPFFTTKETGKGTGLGLSIVYGIIKQHNGFISVSSEPGKGSIFKLYLPMIGSAGSPALVKQAPKPRGGTETILVAEDDDEVRTLIRMVLKGNGYQVIEAIDGQDALAVLSREQKQIDLLLLDVIMPKKNGKEVFDTVRVTHPGIKAIFMSGYTADIIDKKGILAENLNFISKPIAPLELLGVIRDVLDHSTEN